MENYDNILCKNHNTGLILHGFLLLFYAVTFIKKVFYQTYLHSPLSPNPVTHCGRLMRLALTLAVALQGENSNF
jgi:hypothetical protein